MRNAVGIRELKTHLSTYLRMVKNGTTLVVTERGRAIAELRAVPPSGVGEADRLRDLAALGKISLPVRDGLSFFEPMELHEANLSRVVDEDREDRF